MKIIMPLFNFSTNINDTFHFSYDGLSLARFIEEDVIHLDGLSKIDIQQIKLEQWALVYEIEDNKFDNTYREYTNLLLLAYRLFSNNHPPFIKFRMCNEDSSQSSRVSMVMTYIKGKTRNSFDMTELQKIDEGFKHLQQIYLTSDRTKNALYFLLKANSFEKWSESFVMLMIVLEALFSKDEPPYNNTKKTICGRASNLLNSRPRCTKKDIEDLYDIRCNIVHGRLKYKDQTTDNLAKLEHIEYVVSQCFQEMCKQEIYKHFSTDETRNEYISKYLDT